MNTGKLKGYTTDLYALLKHTSNVVRTQKNSNKLTQTDAVDLLHEVDMALTSQMNALDEMEGVMNNGTTTNIKEKVAAFAGTVAGTIETQREDTVSKMLRDDYTALSMIASGYTMLHTAALAEDHEELAGFTKESLTTIARLITQTSKVLPHAVADELDAGQVAEAAETNTQEAWNPENYLVKA